MKTRTLLIDGDIVAYMAAASTQTTYHSFDDDGPVTVAQEEEAYRRAKEIIDGFIETLRADKAIVCLSDDLKNFRKEVLPSYKGNRSGERPTFLYDVKDRLAQDYKFLRWPNLEADDVMGIVSTTPREGERLCIVSADKDLATIPGFLFSPNKDSKPRLITELEADRFFMEQVMTGDPTDNYIGARGIGKKSKFVKALADATTIAQMWGIVLAAYESKGLDEEAAVVQARCARILRRGEYCHDTYRPILWEPPRDGVTKPTI